MPKAASKGTRRERGFVKLCEAAGLRAWRVPGSGAYGVRSNGSQHDVIVETKQTEIAAIAKIGGGLRGRDEDAFLTIVPRKLECEVKARSNGQGFTTINKWKGNADLLVLVEDAASSHEKPRHTVVLDANLFLELIS